MKTTIRTTALSFIAGLALMLRPRVRLTNEDEPETATLTNAMGPTFEGSLTEDGMLVMKIPFGEWPNMAVVNGKKKRLWQVMNEQTAQTMIGMWNREPTVMNRVLTALKLTPPSIKDVPLYKGHPDAPDSGDTDGAAYGWLKDIRVTNEAMELVFEPTEDGLALVKSKAYRFYSPHWQTALIKNDRTLPTVLLSVGFTNRPAIPVPALSNEQGLEAEGSGLEPEAAAVANCCGCNAAVEMKRTLRAKLYLEPDATDEQVLAALDARAAEARRVQADLEALRAQYAQEQQARVTVANELAGVRSLLAEKNAAIAGLTNSAEATLQELAETKTLLVTNELQKLQATGHVKPADYDGQCARLVALSNAELTAELEALAKQKPVLKTGSIMSKDVAEEARTVTITNAADLDTEKAKRRSGFIADYMAAAAMSRVPVDKRRAMAWAALRKQHPELCD